jgi:hypothetical protein
VGVSRSFGGFAGVTRTFGGGSFVRRPWSFGGGSPCRSAAASASFIGQIPGVDPSSEQAFA